MDRQRQAVQSNRAALQRGPTKGERTFWGVPVARLQWMADKLCWSSHRQPVSPFSTVTGLKLAGLVFSYCRFHHHVAMNAWTSERTRSETRYPTTRLCIGLAVNANPLDIFCGCFGGCLFRYSAHSGAGQCNHISGIKCLYINLLCELVQFSAVSCKELFFGLKIRRLQGRGGSSPPPGTMQ